MEWFSYFVMLLNILKNKNIMVILKIIGFFLLGIFIFFVFIGLMFGELKKVGIIEDYVDNFNNKRGYFKGNIF